MPCFSGDSDTNMVLSAGKVTSVRFGPDASYLAVGSSDRNLRIFGAPPTATSES